MEGTFGSYLASLLTTVPAYRAKWDRPDRALRGSGLNQAAVARTVQDHIMATGGDGRTFPAWKTLVWRALGDHSCPVEFLDVLIEVFAIDENPLHEHRLRGAHAAAFGTPRHADSFNDWVPDEVLSRIAPVRPYRTLSINDRHIVGPDRRPVSHRSIFVIEATGAGCDRCFLIAEAGHADSEVVIGGEIVEVCGAGGGLLCHEIAFGREISVGASHVLELVTRFDRDARVPDRVRRASIDRLRRVSMTVEFDPRALPAAIWWGEWGAIAEGADPSVKVEVDLDDAGVASHYVERTLHPVVGFEWAW